MKWKKILCSGGSTIKSDPFWQSNLSSPSPTSFFTPSVHLCLATWTNCLLSDLPKFLLFIEAKAYPLGHLVTYARTNQKRGWKRIDAPQHPTQLGWCVRHHSQASTNTVQSFSNRTLNTNELASTQTFTSSPLTHHSLLVGSSCVAFSTLSVIIWVRRASLL